MGKASRLKAKVVPTPNMLSGLAWAAELVRHPRVLETSLTYRQLAPPAAANDDPDAVAKWKTVLDKMVSATWRPDCTPSAWATSFKPALENPKFAALLHACVVEGHRAFWAEKDPRSAFVFGGNRRPEHDDPRAQAIERVHQRLVADKEAPGWTALTLFCLARMAAVNALLNYDSNEWTELSLVWFDFDRAMFEGDGKKACESLLRIDRDAFRGATAALVGPRMLHGLAEAAINARETALFA